MEPCTNEWLSSLREAIDTYDRHAVRDHCGALLDHLAATRDVPPEKCAKAVLGLLRRKRYFGLMAAVADGFLSAGQTAPLVRRQKAQALIDQGRLGPALDVLNAIVADKSAGPDERAEACGLIGRVQKQRYVNGAGTSAELAEALEEAVTAYWAVYATRPAVFRWHGINAVALKLRAARDRVAVATEFDPARVAQAILDDISTQVEPSASDLATAAEAWVALGKFPDALSQAEAFLEKREADAFEIASFLRQLREVWGLKEDPPAGALMLTLQAALLTREGGAVDLEPGALPRTRIHLEQTFGRDGPMPIKLYQRALDRAKCVGRVGNDLRATLGTGVLLRARDFFPNARDLPGDEVILLTNAHVVGKTYPDAIRPGSALVRLEGSDDVHPVTKLLWESCAEELDAVFVRLKDPPPSCSCALTPRDDEPVLSAPPRRLYVIGYPMGAELSISLHDNHQLGWKSPRLHYRTPTESGSSGSGVYDGNWQLVALHHGGGKSVARLNGAGEYEANEGIWIHAIADATRRVQ